MRKKRHRLRLRKQVIVCIPIVIFVISLITLLVIKKNNVFTSEVSTQNNQVEASNLINDIKKLSERDFIKNLDSFIVNRQKDNTVIYYAQKFKLNVDKVLEIAHNFTDNFESEIFNQTFAITSEEYREKIGNFNSFEAGVVYFVRDIYRYPTRYGTTQEEIRLSDSIEVDKRIVDKTIYLDNGLTYEQYLGKICDLYDLDKGLALAISYHETGVLTSNLFMNGNNVGGQRGYNGWMKYSTLEAGIIGYVISLKSILDGYSIDIYSENGLNDLSAIYVNGNLGAGPSLHWAEKVAYFKGKIEEQDLFSVGN